MKNKGKISDAAFHFQRELGHSTGFNAKKNDSGES